MGQWEQRADAAVGEAKQKTEDSKASALGYYQGLQPAAEQTLQSQLGAFSPAQETIAGMSPDAISPDQMRSLEANRRSSLAASGQHMAGMFGDSSSGIAREQRGGVARDIALQQGNLPIHLQMEVDAANRQARTGLAGQQMALGSAQAGMHGGYYDALQRQAGGMAGVEQAYQYDPGAGYYAGIGQGLGGLEGVERYTGGTPMTSPDDVGGAGAEPTSAPAPATGTGKVSMPWAWKGGGKITSGKKGGTSPSFGKGSNLGRFQPVKNPKGGIGFKDTRR